MARHARKPDDSGSPDATPGSPSCRKEKTATGRIVLRICSALLSVVFLTSGCGILYVRGLLKRIDRTEFTGNSDFSFVGDIPTFSDNEWAASETDSAGSTASGVTVEQNIQNLDKAHGGYSDVQNISLLNDPDIQNILLIGADLTGLGDTTIIVSINRRTGKIHLSSLMRAMYVRIPDQPAARQWFMFNHAYAWGGPKLVMKTIENNFRVKIDDYVTVNFSTFPKVIDLLGGIDLTLTQAEASYLTSVEGTSFRAGNSHLNGQQALSYARMRKSSRDDTDFKRTSRQRNVITALIQKATSMGLGTLNNLAVNLLPLIKTSLSDGEILSLAASAPSLISYPISQKMLPIENDTSAGQGNHFYGMMYVKYPGGRDDVEVYKVDFIPNVKALHEFILS